MLVAEPGTVPFAGGLDVVNRMKEGWAPERLMMLSGVGGLDAIRHHVGDHAIEIGATARHDEVATNQVIRSKLPDLGQCWDRIATIRIRMQGTVAGNLLAGQPSYEGSVLLSALGASLSFRRAGSAAASAVSDLHGQDGPGSFGGLATGILVPLPPSGVSRRLVYDRSLRPTLSMALRLDRTEDVVTSARAVLGGCHVWPVTRDLPLQGLMLSDLAGSADDLAAQAFHGAPPMTVPWFGAPGYRERVAPVVLARLIREAAR